MTDRHGWRRAPGGIACITHAPARRDPVALVERR
jgi:hypothetical protein